MRRKEGASAAALIGAQYRCAEFRDLTIFNDDASRRRITELLRELNPDIVITSAPVDYMCDHEATSVLVRDACFAAPAPNYSAGTSAPLKAIPHLYYMDAISGLDREGRPIYPDFIVNVKSKFEIKKAMLAAHASQREWLRKHHNMDDYLDQMERWTTECGRRANIEFGEGFRRYQGHPYPQTPLLEELLGSNVVVPRRL
jgi:LmbE family N-acetylglucosaminyl deacetylase